MKSNNLIVKILSLRDFYSSFAGIVISGYVVRVSINQNINNHHIIAMILGVFIGICLVKLIKISKKFELNKEIAKQDYNKESIVKSNSEINAETLDGLKKSNKNVVQIITLNFTLSIVFLVSAIFLIRYGNNELSKENTKNQEELIIKLDSLFDDKLNKVIDNNNQESLIKDIDSIVKSEVGKINVIKSKKRK